MTEGTATKEDLNVRITMTEFKSGFYGKPGDPLLSITYAEKKDRDNMWPQRLLHILEMGTREKQEGN
jgi:hypothetical protein